MELGMMMIVIFNAGVRGVVTVVVDGVVLTTRRRHYWTAMEREVAVIAVTIIIGRRWRWVLTMNNAAAEEGSRCRRTVLRWDGRYHCHRRSQSRANDGRCCRGISDQYSVLSDGVVFVDVGVAGISPWKKFRSSVICNHIPVQCEIFFFRSSASPWPMATHCGLLMLIVDHQVRTYTTMQNSPLMNDNPALTQSITIFSSSVFQQQ